VTLNNLTVQELLKHANDMMREDREFLKDFNAAVDQLQKKQAEFQAECRYSQRAHRLDFE
jgi:hypothetical protein